MFVSITVTTYATVRVDGGHHSGARARRGRDACISGHVHDHDDDGGDEYTDDNSDNRDRAGDDHEADESGNDHNRHDFDDSDDNGRTDFFASLSDNGVFLADRAQLSGRCGRIAYAASGAGIDRSGCCGYE
jgi:hypothetical protein